MKNFKMCNNLKCNLTKTCYRFNATPKEMQCYGVFEQNENGKCDHFMELEEHKDLFEDFKYKSIFKPSDTSLKKKIK